MDKVARYLDLGKQLQSMDQQMAKLEDEMDRVGDNIENLLGSMTPEELAAAG